MTRLVVDASVAVEYLLRTPLGITVANTLDSASLVTSELMDAEVLSVLRRAVLSGVLEEARAGMAVEDLAHWPAERISHQSSSSGSPSLPVRSQLSSVAPGRDRQTAGEADAPAHGNRLFSTGVSTRRGPARLIPAHRLNLDLIGRMSNLRQSHRHIRGQVLAHRHPRQPRPFPYLPLTVSCLPRVLEAIAVHLCIPSSELYAYGGRPSIRDLQQATMAYPAYAYIWGQALLRGIVSAEILAFIDARGARSQDPCTSVQEM